MPFYDDTARNAALDALWGDGHAASMPDDFEVGLIVGDPSDSGVEFSGDGYARVSLPNDNTTWLDAADGLKTSVLIAFADATDAWDAADFWGIWVAGDLFDYGRLGADVTVTAAGPGPQIRIARYFDPLAI